MDFNSDRPIFRQIVDLCHDRILAGQWRPGERVPSVRELGVELAVNSHTALKAYDELQAEGVIVSRRGLGFFLADDATESVMRARRREFFDQTLPRLFARMDTLGITLDELLASREAYEVTGGSGDTSR